MRALQRAKKVFRSPDEIRELCPTFRIANCVTNRGYDCMGAGGRAKQDARAASPSPRDRNIHRTVGGASAARLLIASSPNSHLAVCQAQCWSKKKRSSEYSGLSEHSDKAMIGRDF